MQSKGYTYLGIWSFRSIFVQGANLLHQYVLDVRKGSSVINKFVSRSCPHTSASRRSTWFLVSGFCGCSIIRRRYVYRGSSGHPIGPGGKNHQEDGQQPSCWGLHVVAYPENNRALLLNDKDVSRNHLRANYVSTIMVLQVISWRVIEDTVICNVLCRKTYFVAIYLSFYYIFLFFFK